MKAALKRNGSRAVYFLVVLTHFLGFSLADVIKLTWKPSARSVSGYNIYRSAGNGSLERLNTIPVVGSTFVDNRAEPGQVYRYTVTAIGANGTESGFSVEAVISMGLPRQSSGRHSSYSAPRAVAGSDLSARGGETVVLDGQVINPGKLSVSTSWTQIGGPLVRLVPAGAARVSFLAPVVTADTRLEFRLLVKDSSGLESADVIGVLVRKNSAPTLEVSSSSVADAGSLVELGAKASDPEGDGVRVTWTQTSGPAVSLKRKGQSVSFQAPVSDSSYEMAFRVEAGDGLLSTEKTVRVVVRDQYANSLVVPTSPFAGGAEDAYVGVGLLNALSHENPVAFYAVDADGRARDTAASALAPRNQVTFLAHEYASPEEVSLLAHSQNGPIQGMFLVGDNGQRRLDGIGGELVRSRNLHFILSREDRQEKLSLYLNNPDTQSAVEAHIEMYAHDGTLLEARDVVIEKAGAYLRALEQDLPASFRSGYVKVTSDSVLRGCVMQAKTEAFEVTAAQAPKPTPELLLPHFFVGPNGGETVLRLYNSGVDAIHVRVQAFSSDAAVLGERVVQLAPGKLTSKAVSRLFGFPLDRVTSGYIRVGSVDGEALDLLANVSLQGNGGKFATNMALSSTSRSDTTFLHVAQSDEHGLFSGLSILNPGDQAAPVTATVYDSEGREKASVHFEIPAGQRRIDLLNGSQYFGKDFHQVGGSLRIQSSVPTVAMFLIGDYQQEFLTALDGQLTQ